MAAAPEAVDQVIFGWGLDSRFEVEALRSHPVAFTVLVNERAASLGNHPRSIKARILGDIEVAKSEFGESEVVHWN